MPEFILSSHVQPNTQTCITYFSVDVNLETGTKIDGVCKNIEHGHGSSLYTGSTHLLLLQELD